MPKRQTQRIIDSRRRNSSATIIGATGSGVPVSLTAGDGLTLTGTTLDVGAGDGISVAADAVAVDSTVVRTTRTVTAGSGLTGGGALSSDLTLNVGAGTLITVGADTVGITTGANYQYIGTGSGTAAAWQNLSGLAGAGLTHSAGVLAVGAGSGITVNADDVALTTPGTLTVATTNSATGSHTHAVTSSSNVGDTPAAAILASTAAGGLTLASLAVRGSVDVTNGGDLTVAGSGAYAGSSVLFVDSSGGNVGIMGAPDPQFALDVVGPCRATWFVGPHAIQLKDVLLLSHFDGRQPFETNYSGEPNGHMGQVATVAGGLIYRPGKFGTKAAQFDIGTQYNYVTNPSFGTGSTGWSAITSAALDVTPTVGAVYGVNALRITFPGGTTDGAYFQHVTATHGTYTASAYVKAYAPGDVGDNVSIYMRFAYTDATTSDTTPTTHTITDDWVRITNTGATNGAKTLSYILVFLRDTLSGAAHYVVVDAVQLEVSSYATSYIDGSLGSGHAWSGTAHASTSYRTTAQLSYPTSGNIDAAEGTVMAWVNLTRSAATQTILRATGTTAGNIFLAIVSGNLVGYWGTAGITGSAVSANEWHHVVMSYDGATVTLYLDGVAVASGASAGFAGMPANMSIGGNGTSDLLRGLIDDLVITKSVIDADGIRAIYESDAPVFAESSRFSFRATPQGLVWADDEGLWMRNAAGSAVLGAYGSSATKSWAGVTLSPSDVVIGDGSRGGYVLWDDSAATLSVQGTITALAGSVGGWTIASGRLTNDTGTAATSAGLSPADYPFYAGRTYANRATAPFRVTPAGVVTATSGTVGGWTLGATALTAGSGSSTVGLDAGGTNPAIYAGSATPGSAPFRVTKAGALYAEGADVRGAITASSGSITGTLTIGTSGEIRQGTGTLGVNFTGMRIWNDSGYGRIGGYTSDELQWFSSSSGKLFTGYRTDIDKWSQRFAKDGVKFYLEETSSLNIPTNSSALRWVAGSVDDTVGGAYNYTGVIGYRNTTANVVDAIMTSYVGSGSYTTQSARAIMQAGNYDGSTYRDAYFYVYKSAGAGGATLGHLQADYFSLSGYIMMTEISAPSSPAANTVVLYAEDNGSGKTRLMAKFSSGSAVQIAIQP